MSDVRTRLINGGAGELCESILTELPQWFGIPEANADYVEHANDFGGVVGSVDGVDVGITTIVEHGPYSAEIYLMAVRPDHHRSGIGRAMLAAAEADLGRRGIEFLQVKTLSPLRPDANYAATRAFYEAYGFRMLEEHPLLWGPENPALQLIKAVARVP